jgi:predicted SprT family Zn-dependent metalloprotease
MPARHPAPGALPLAARKALRAWGRLWGDPHLSASITIGFSPRLRTSLGRATPATGRVTLHTALRTGPIDRLLEVLCHEVAHVAAVRRATAKGAPRPRPHGAEWAALVRAAGFAPATHISRAALQRVIGVPATAPPRALRAQTRHGRIVVHSCPVCHTERLARRAVPAWRCAECVAAGLSGMLVITHRERSTA